VHDPILLETERLILRMFTPADLEDLHRQLSDPEVMRYYPKVSSREDSEKWLQGILKDYQSNGYGMLAVCLRDTGEYIGQAGVMRRLIDGCEHHYLSYLLCKESWGHGYATEAVQRILDYGFQTLDIHKVEALIRPDNARSIRLAEKLGMQHESTTEHAGRPHYVYTVTR
jgi:[ribosomal protein S5]-alanine N-acetyltransferase